MNDASMIGQYEQSCSALRARVAQLNDKIYGRVPFGERESQKTLQERRRYLYAEIVEMEEALELLRRM